MHTTDPTDPYAATYTLNQIYRAGGIDEADYWQAYKHLNSEVDRAAAPQQCEYTRWDKRCKVQAIAYHDGHAYCAFHWRVMRGGG